MTVSILVIDDSRTIRRSVQRTLEQAGYSVVAAPDGCEGLKRWQETRPDLVITDIMMPERDGIETIIEIRRHVPTAKILAMTGFRLTDGLEFPAMLRHLGADDVLTKPFGPDLLLAKVDALLKRAPVAVPAG